uniref:Chemotaxis protein n=1 Tax=Meloidogyne hapla TaxID=6305 RepID=A0A1I8BAZ5_MELHA
MNQLQRLFTLTDKRMDTLQSKISTISNSHESLTELSVRLTFCFSGLHNLAFRVAATSTTFSSNLKEIIDGWFSIKREEGLLSEMSAASSMVAKVKEIISLLTGVNEQIFVGIEEMDAETLEYTKKQLQLMLSSTQHFVS